MDKVRRSWGGMENHFHDDNPYYKCRYYQDFVDAIENELKTELLQKYDQQNTFENRSMVEQYEARYQHILCIKLAMDIHTITYPTFMTFKCSIFTDPYVN